MKHEYNNDRATSNVELMGLIMLMLSKIEESETFPEDMKRIAFRRVYRLLEKLYLSDGKEALSI